MAHLLLLLFGCACLFAGGHALITGAMALGKRINLSPALMVWCWSHLALARRSLAVSLDAALTDHGDMAVGNVVGSNIANLALVLGIAVVARRLPASGRSIWRDFPMLMLLTLVAIMMLGDRYLSRARAVVLLILSGDLFPFHFQGGRRR